MSWSAQFNVVDGNIKGVPVVSGTDTSEHLEQYLDALQVVDEYINYGSLGSPLGSYRVMITGHGNPNHEPVAGWSNDFININIQQVIE